jgi:WD40 repeat protein
LKVLKGHPSPVTSVVFSPDGTRLASGCGGLRSEGDIRFWNVSTGDLRHTITCGESIVHEIALSPDAEVLAAGMTATGLLWHVGERKQLPWLEGIHSIHSIRVVCRIRLLFAVFDSRLAERHLFPDQTIASYESGMSIIAGQGRSSRVTTARSGRSGLRRTDR